MGQPIFFFVIAIIIIIFLVLFTGEMTVIFYLNPHLTAFPLCLWLSEQTLLRESEMLFLSALTVTFARKCAYNRYLKWIFQLCSSKKILVYLKSLHIIPLACSYAWKKSGSSIQHIRSLVKTAATQIKTIVVVHSHRSMKGDFVSQYSRWVMMHFLLGCLRFDLKKCCRIVSFLRSFHFWNLSCDLYAFHDAAIPQPCR